jgi:hypothetical protein
MQVQFYLDVKSKNEKHSFLIFFQSIIIIDVIIIFEDSDWS